MVQSEISVTGGRQAMGNIQPAEVNRENISGSSAYKGLTEKHKVKNS
jgi:hypothetical protein